MGARLWPLMCVILAAHGEAAIAQSTASTMNEFIYVNIEPVSPTGSNHSAPIRSAEMVLPASHRLPPSAMPKPLAGEHGAFHANAVATMTIGPDDSQTDCHPGKATIVRGDYREKRAEEDLAIDVCGLLKDSTRFHHAIDANGQPEASGIKVSIFFSSSSITAPPPPKFTPGHLTSGHVLDDKGSVIDTLWLSSRFSILVANWTAALIDQRNLPKDAQVGVLLDLKANAGIGAIESCTVAKPSGDPRLDKATCWALSFGSYAPLGGGSVTYGAHGYPLMVQWHGEKAAIAPLADLTVPHMPKDVVLTPTDRPGNADPAQHVAELDIELDTAGHVTGCLVKVSSGSDAWDAASCRQTLKRARFTAAQNWFGMPARGLYRVRVDWSAMAIAPAHL